MTEPIGDSRWWHVGLALTALALHPVLTFWVDNWRSQPDVGSLLVASLIGFIAGAALFTVLHLLGRIARWPAAAVAGAGMVLVANWGRIASLFDWTGRLALLAAAVIVTALLVRTRSKAIRSGVFVVILVVTAVPIGQLLILEAQAGSPTVDTGQDFVLADADLSPDIYVVVLDGYARPDVLEADYDLEVQPFTGWLQEQGFTVAGSATAAYSMTHLSIPSLLSMGYPLGDGHSMTVSDQRQLYRMMQGDNPLARALRAAGYRYVHGESGWAGTNCGASVDLCLSGGMYDHTLEVFLQRTAIPSVFGHALIHPFTGVALERFDQFRRWDEVVTGSRTGPDFVFLHVIAPHPPLFLLPDCATSTDPNRGATVMADSTFSSELVEQRRHAYADQVECVNSMLPHLLESLPSNAVVILLSDHGPDSRAQLFEDPDSWTSEATRERMGVLLAIKTPEPCEVPPDVVLPNAMRLVMNCVHGTDLEILPPEHYRAPAEGAQWTEVTAIAVP